MAWLLDRRGAGAELRRRAVERARQPLDYYELAGRLDSPEAQAIRATAERIASGKAVFIESDLIEPGTAGTVLLDEANRLQDVEVARRDRGRAAPLELGYRSTDGRVWCSTCWAEVADLERHRS